MNSSKQLKKKNEEAALAGGAERTLKQHNAGKLTARERITELLDIGTFQELDKFVVHRSQNFGLEKKKILGDGVVTGSGKIDGRDVYIYAQDFTVFGGSLAEMHAKKICKVMDLATQNGCPIIGLSDSGGARIQEGVESLGGYADIFLRNVLTSGVVPQLSLILGPCAGGAVYSPAITDFVIMAEDTSHMFITGPDVIKTVTREEVTKEELGGAATHSSKSGVCHLTAPNEKEVLLLTKKLLSYLPQNNLEQPPHIDMGDIPGRTNNEISKVIPNDPNKPYDTREIITNIVDAHEFFEIQPNFAQNIVVGFGRLDGNSIGIVANQPQTLAGCLDIDASSKAARFVRFCDAFNIPLLTLVDVPGFLPGVHQEHGGIIRHGAKLLYAYAESTVPKVTIITRKAYGGAYDVMSSKHIRSDFNFAYPNSEVAVMGPEGAVSIIFRKELTVAAEKGNLKEVKDKLINDYKKKFSNPWTVAELGFIDAVIDPKETRPTIIRSFELLKNKRQANPRKKHGNIPL